MSYFVWIHPTVYSLINSFFQLSLFSDAFPTDVLLSMQSLVNTDFIMILEQQLKNDEKLLLLLLQLLSLLVTLVLQSLSNILPSYTNGNYFLYWRHPRHLIFNKHINYVKAKLHIHRILLKVLHQACWEKTEAEHLCENRKREDLEKTVTGIVCKTLLNCRTITSTLSAGRWDIDAG